MHALSSCEANAHRVNGDLIIGDTKIRLLTFDEQDVVTGGFPPAVIVGVATIGGGLANAIQGFDSNSTWSSVGRDFAVGAVAGAVGSVAGTIALTSSVALTTTQFVVRSTAVAAMSGTAAFQTERAFDIASSGSSGGGPENNGRDKRSDRGQPEEEPQ